MPDGMDSSTSTSTSASASTSSSVSYTSTSKVRVHQKVDTIAAGRYTTTSTSTSTCSGSDTKNTKNNNKKNSRFVVTETDVSTSAESPSSTLTLPSTGSICSKSKNQERVEGAVGNGQVFVGVESTTTTTTTTGISNGRSNSNSIDHIKAAARAYALSGSGNGTGTSTSTTTSYSSQSQPSSLTTSKKSKRRPTNTSSTSTHSISTTNTAISAGPLVPNGSVTHYLPPIHPQTQLHTYHYPYPFPHPHPSAPNGSMFSAGTDAGTATNMNMTSKEAAARAYALSSSSASNKCKRSRGKQQHQQLLPQQQQPFIENPHTYPYAPPVHHYHHPTTSTPLSTATSTLPIHPVNNRLEQVPQQLQQQQQQWHMHLPPPSRKKSKTTTTASAMYATQPSSQIVPFRPLPSRSTGAVQPRFSNSVEMPPPPSSQLPQPSLPTTASLACPGAKAIDNADINPSNATATIPATSGRRRKSFSLSSSSSTSVVPVAPIGTKDKMTESVKTTSTSDVVTIRSTKPANTQTPAAPSIVVDDDLDEYDRFVKLLGTNLSEADDDMLNNLIIDDEDDEFQLEEVDDEDDEEDDDDDAGEDDEDEYDDNNHDDSYADLSSSDLQRKNIHLELEPVHNRKGNEDDFDTDWDAQFYQELAEELGSLEQEDMEAAVTTLLQDYPNVGGSNGRKTTCEKGTSAPTHSSETLDAVEPTPLTSQSPLSSTDSSPVKNMKIRSTSGTETAMTSAFENCSTPNRNNIGRSTETSTTATATNGTPVNLMKRLQVLGGDLQLAQQQLIPLSSNTSHQDSHHLASFATKTTTPTKASVPPSSDAVVEGCDVEVIDNANTLGVVSYDHHAVVTPDQHDQLHELLQKHYQLLIQQAVLAVRAAHVQRTKRASASSITTGHTTTVLSSSSLATANVSSSDTNSPDGHDVSRAPEFLAGGETADDLTEILDGAVTMLQDLDHNRKDSIRQYIQFDATTSGISTSRKRKFNFHSQQTSKRSLMAEFVEQDHGVRNEESGKLPRFGNRSDSLHIGMSQRRLTRAQFTKTLQEEQEKRLISSSGDREGTETIFDIRGLSKLKETFNLIDKSVDGMRLKGNNAYKCINNTHISTNCIDNTNNILEMSTNRQACEHILEHAGANINSDMVPGARDLSENFVNAQEYFGDDFEPPCSSEHALALRRNRNLFTSGEDNLVLRGVNLYGEKQWHLIADRFLPDRSINNISQRYSKICYLLYKAHGIYIDDKGNLAKPPKLESVDDLDDDAIGRLKKVDPPAIMNVHRWSPEEDLTLLMAVPLMGSMWAELKARLIPHRDRGHLRKRYQVLERRVKATVTRIVKNERIHINKLSSPVKTVSQLTVKMSGVGKGKATTAKGTSIRLFGDSIASDKGDVIMREKTEEQGGYKEPNISAHKQESPASGNTVHIRKTNVAEDTATQSPHGKNVVPAIPTKRGSPRKSKLNANNQESTEELKIFNEGNTSTANDAHSHNGAGSASYSVPHKQPESPAQHYQHSYPMPRPPPPPHHAVYPHYYPPYPYNAVPGYHHLPPLPTPGYPYHHPPYVHMYPPQVPNQYSHNNDDKYHPPWLSPSPNVDESSRAQFEKLVHDGANDWTQLDGDFDVTIASTIVTSLAKSPTTKGQRENRDTSIDSNPMHSGNFVRIDSNFPTHYGLQSDVANVTGTAEQQATESVSFLAGVLERSSSRSNNTGSGTHSKSESTEGIAVGVTSAMKKETMETPSKTQIIHTDSEMSTPTNVRMSLFGTSPGDGFSNMSTELQMSQLSKFSPGSGLNNGNHHLGDENVDSLQFGDKSIASYEVHHTFPSTSRLTDAAIAIEEKEQGRSSLNASDENSNLHYKESSIKTVLFSDESTLEIVSALNALSHSPAKSSVCKSSNEHHNSSATEEIKNECNDELPKKPKSLFSKVVGSSYNHDAGTCTNSSKDATVKKSNVGKRQKLMF